MRTTTESKQKLREICRIAARVFYEKGYDGASMQDIAKAVGLTKAGLYCARSRSGDHRHPA
jgi:AcrR family transcriptional regulator